MDVYLSESCNNRDWVSDVRYLDQKVDHEMKTLKVCAVLLVMSVALNFWQLRKFVIALNGQEFDIAFNSPPPPPVLDREMFTVNDGAQTLAVCATEESPQFPVTISIRPEIRP
jgi:hypothetical protein